MAKKAVRDYYLQQAVISERRSRLHLNRTIQVSEIANVCSVVPCYLATDHVLFLDSDNDTYAHCRKLKLRTPNSW